MGAIRRLPPELSNQIAAGEVVERPASAVKELVENSIDAGATRISITIELGGKRLLKVEDDGEGMTATDAGLAIERHATSKLSNMEDLDVIETLGFRGEALPSIASVSHMVLRTKTQTEPYGTEIRVDGGEVGSPVAVGMPSGTGVEVLDMFYNVPARRKFLKSDSAESSQTSRVVTQLALSRPEIAFVLTSGSRTLLQLPAVKSLDERLFQIYGNRSELVPVQKTAAGVRLWGWIATLTENGRARAPQNVFVNGRAVKDRTVSHAIRQAYAKATLKSRTPEVHLFIEIPPDRVDVNVHPMKSEVRFLESSLIHELIRRALGDALGEPSSAPLSTALGSKAEAKLSAQSIPGVTHGMSAGSRWSNSSNDGLFRGLGTSLETIQKGVEPEGVSKQNVSETNGLNSFIPLGQFRDTFIIAVDNDSIVIIDQHVAHERILFEQMMTRLTTGRLEGQRLLTPLVIQLPAGQRESLNVHADHLATLGFEVDPFGGDTVQVTIVPGLLERSEAERTVRELASDLEGFDRRSTVDDVLRKLAATMACHAAVKANDRLTSEKMFYILERLHQAEYATVCPHGRPVVLRLTRGEVEKSFER